MRNNFIDISMHDGLVSLKSLVRHYDTELAEHLQGCAHGPEEDWLFAYRWLLLDFKREFPFDEVLVLWERIWAQYCTSHFHIFLALGIFLHYRTEMMALGHDDLLVYLNTLSGNISFFSVMQHATKAVWKLKADPTLPADLKILVTPSSGGTFVPPPIVGFRGGGGRRKKRSDMTNTLLTGIAQPPVFPGMQPAPANPGAGSAGSSAAGAEGVGWGDPPPMSRPPGRQYHLRPQDSVGYNSTARARHQVLNQVAPPVIHHPTMSVIPMYQMPTAAGPAAPAQGRRPGRNRRYSTQLPSRAGPLAAAGHQPGYVAGAVQPPSLASAWSHHPTQQQFQHQQPHASQRRAASEPVYLEPGAYATSPESPTRPAAAAGLLYINQPAPPFPHLPAGGGEPPGSGGAVPTSAPYQAAAAGMPCGSTAQLGAAPRPGKVMSTAVPGDGVSLAVAPMPSSAPPQQTAPQPTDALAAGVATVALAASPAPAGPHAGGAAAPTAWIEYANEAGMPYFFRVGTGETMWVRPESGTIWVQFFSAEGHRYFHCAATGETSWTMPGAPAATG